MEDTYDTCAPRAYYLRTLIEAVYIPSGEFENALETCGKLTAIVERYSEQWIEARWFLTDVRGDLLAIYNATNRKDLEKQTVADGKQYLVDYENWIAELSASSSDKEAIYKDSVGGEEIWSLPNLHQQYYQFALHDFACRCMWTGHYKDAMKLFEKALAIRDDVSASSETHFFLAGSILKATGDREKSFEHFRQAVLNPFFSRRHELKQAFIGETTFEDVWDDEQFVSLIDKEVQKQVQQTKE
jgi:tetratricopeptide (TPR) repeat protein